MTGPRAVRRTITRGRAVQWDKPASTRPTLKPRPPRLLTDSDSGRAKLSKAPVLKPVPYTPEPPTPKLLFPDIPALITTPLGQSRILAESMPSIPKHTAAFTPEDWKKYDNLREKLARKVLAGFRDEWGAAQEGKQVEIDDARRLVSKNKTLTVKAKRVVMETLWDRLDGSLSSRPAST